MANANFQFPVKTLVSNCSDPVIATDLATKNYIDTSLANIAGAIRSAGNPTTSTVGTLNQFYVNTTPTPNTLFQCSNINTTTTPPTYTWVAVSGSGGGTGSSIGSTTVIVKAYNNFATTPNPSHWIPTQGVENQYYSATVLPFGVTTNTYSDNTGYGLINGVPYIKSDATSTDNGNALVFPTSIDQNSDIGFRILIIKIVIRGTIFSVPPAALDLALSVCNDSIIAAQQAPFARSIAFFDAGSGFEQFRWFIRPTVTIDNVNNVITLTGGEAFMFSDFLGASTYTGSTGFNRLFLTVDNTSSGGFCTTAGTIDMTQSDYSMIMTIGIQGSGGGGSGGGGVQSVTGNIVTNLDPTRPIVTQVQSDWNATTGLGVVLNKPTIIANNALLERNTLLTTGADTSILAQSVANDDTVTGNGTLSADTTTLTINNPSTDFLGWAQAYSGRYCYIIQTAGLGSLLGLIAYNSGGATITSCRLDGKSGERNYFTPGVAYNISCVVLENISGLATKISTDTVYTAVNYLSFSNNGFSYVISTLDDGSIQGLLTATALPQIQSDWNQTNTALADFIKNKPVIVNGVRTVTGNIVSNTDPFNPIITQVQSDWNATSGLGVVLNKPSVLGAALLERNTVLTNGNDASIFAQSVATGDTVTGNGTLSANTLTLTINSPSADFLSWSQAYSGRYCYIIQTTGLGSLLGLIAYNGGTPTITNCRLDGRSGESNYFTPNVVYNISCVVLENINGLSTRLNNSSIYTAVNSLAFNSNNFTYTLNNLDNGNVEGVLSSTAPTYTAGLNIAISSSNVLSTVTNPAFTGGSFSGLTAISAATSYIPTKATDLSTKGYVDSLSNGDLHIGTAVACAADSQISLTTPPATIDGYTLVANDRIAVVGQGGSIFTADPTNGVYIFTNTTTPLTRAIDANTVDEIQGLSVLIKNGTLYADQSYYYDFIGLNPMIGTTNIIAYPVQSGSNFANNVIITGFTFIRGGFNCIGIATFNNNVNCTKYVNFNQPKFRAVATTAQSVVSGDTIIQFPTTDNQQTNNGGLATMELTSSNSNGTFTYNGTSFTSSSYRVNVTIIGPIITTPLEAVVYICQGTTSSSTRYVGWSGNLSTIGAGSTQGKLISFSADITLTTTNPSFSVFIYHLNPTAININSTVWGTGTNGNGFISISPI